MTNAWRFDARYGLVLGGAILGLGIGTVSAQTRSPELLAAAGCFLFFGVLAVLMWGTVPVTFATVCVTAVLLPHVLYNMTFTYTLVSIAIALSVGLLGVVRGSRGRWRIVTGDVGACLLLVAQILPAMLSKNVSVIPGLAIITLGVYVAARLARPSAAMITCGFLIGGAFLGIIGLMQRVAILAPLVPFTPMRDGAPYITRRAVGLFNNPNTFGTVEAMIIIAAVVYGLNRPRLFLACLCFAGLLASHSREALLGLVLALLVMYVRRPVHIAFVSMAALPVVAGFFLLFPSTASHFDPRGFSTDSNLLGRIDQWKMVAQHIPESPIIGFGLDIPVEVIDNAYLGWLMSGGVIGATLWISGLALLFAGNRFLPVLVVALGVAMLGNPYGGPTLAILLILSGAQLSETLNAGLKGEKRVIDESGRSAYPVAPGRVT